MRSRPVSRALAAVVLPAMLSSLTAAASERPSTQLALYDRQLVLNGYGERELWWTNIYECALYLQALSTALRDIGDPHTAKTIRIRVLFDDLPENMLEEWRRIFQDELSRDLFDRLGQTYSTLRGNDVLIFSYHPERGTEFWINKVRLLTDPEDGLMLDLLDQWLGTHPVSHNLKRRLLGIRT